MTPDEIREALRVAVAAGTFVFPDDGTDTLTPEQEAQLQASATRVLLTEDKTEVVIASGLDVIAIVSREELEAALQPPAGGTS